MTDRCVRAGFMTLQEGRTPTEKEKALALLAVYEGLTFAGENSEGQAVFVAPDDRYKLPIDKKDLTGVITDLKAARGLFLNLQNNGANGVDIPGTIWFDPTRGSNFCERRKSPPLSRAYCIEETGTKMYVFVKSRVRVSEILDAYNATLATLSVAAPQDASPRLRVVQTMVLGR